MIGINKNIEVINENLWAVEFAYVKQGWIKELTINKSNTSDTFCFTQDGKLILNKGQSCYKDILKYLNILMNFKSEELASNRGFYLFIKSFIPKHEKLKEQDMDKFILIAHLEKVKEMFYQLSDIELKRRVVYSEYHKNYKKPIFSKLLRNLKEKLRKGGEDRCLQ